VFSNLSKQKHCFNVDKRQDVETKDVFLNVSSLDVA